MGPDRRRRDAGDALSSPRSGEHRDGPMPPQPEGRMAAAGSMRRRASSPMKEHRLLGAPSLLPASAMRAPPQSSAMPRAARPPPNNSIVWEGDAASRISAAF